MNPTWLEEDNVRIRLFLNHHFVKDSLVLIVLPVFQKCISQEMRPQVSQ